LAWGRGGADAQRAQVLAVHARRTRDLLGRSLPADATSTAEVVSTTAAGVSTAAAGIGSTAGGTSAFPPLNASHSAVDDCAPPPTETCCTRYLRAASNTLRARFPFPAILTSVTIWNTAPAPSPPRPAGALANVSISVGRDATVPVTDCAIIDPPSPPSDPAIDPAWMSGFTRKALLCLTAATFAAIRIPRPATAWPPAALAVKVCVVRLDAAAALRDGALWLQEAPP